MVSVMVVDVPPTASVCVAPVTATPEVTVVMVWLVQPLLPVKVKLPTAPRLVLLSVTVVRTTVIVTVAVDVAPFASEIV